MTMIKQDNGIIRKDGTENENKRPIVMIESESRSTSVTYPKQGKQLKRGIGSLEP